MSRSHYTILALLLAAPLLALSTPASHARPLNLSAVILQDQMDPAPDQTAPADPGTTAPADTGGDDGLAVDPKWHPNKALLKGLPVSTKIGPYPIRVPAGLKTKKAPFHNDYFTGVVEVWSTDFKSKAPGMIISSAVLRVRPDEDIILEGPEQMDALDAMADQMFIHEPSVVKSDKQEGDVDGVTATRQYFKFTDSKSGRKYHGFQYVATVNRVAALLVAIMAEPASAKQLPIMEAGTIQFLQGVAKRQ